MREYEKIELYNVNNGERFSTYIIKGKRGSGEISLNGAAARRAHVGDLLIICTYAPMNEEQVASYKPKVVLLGEGNKIKAIKET
jgi:aspartate 1-decarboxylase